MNLVNPVENALRVLHDPLARRSGGSFPMIGKIFRHFSNDWKKMFPMVGKLFRRKNFWTGFTGWTGLRFLGGWVGNEMM